MIETETADQVLSLVEHNLGVGFFPASAAQEFIDAGRIVKVPLDLSPILRKTHLVYHPQRVRGLAALKAIDSSQTRHLLKAGGKGKNPRGFLVFPI